MVIYNDNLQPYNFTVLSSLSLEYNSVVDVIKHFLGGI